MQFKDTKQGYPIYVIDRKNVTVAVGKITNSPVPHFDNHFPGAGKMVVDLTIDCDGKVDTYVMEDSAEVGYAGTLVITANRECVARELESIYSNSDQALSMMPYHKEAKEKSEKLLKEYSQEYKERSEFNDRLEGLENNVEKLTKSFSEFLERMKGGLK
ncbi:MAG: hypothetical protein KBT28_04630 [Bacteroidales bacterium]|nr:hypothetical protein [Candidatus Colimorpha merdihippi]